MNSQGHYKALVKEQILEGLFDLIGGINKNKTIYCFFSKERQISIVMFIQSNLLF